MSISSSTFSIVIYGCQMNVYDGDRLRSALTLGGWTESGAVEDADAVIFVTCSIRDKAEQKVLSELGRFRPRGPEQKRQLVVLTGCMAQRLGESIAQRFPWVKLIAGPRHIGSIPGALEDILADGRTRILLDSDPRELIDLSCAPTVTTNAHKAFVTIAHGCDQFCSYCIVPYVRGRFKSRTPDAILSEIEELVSGGVMEIALLGQNVNTYGKDFDEGSGLHGYRLAKLLRDVSSIPGLRRLRFTTSHPLDFTDDILDVMTSNNRVCPSINLPVQSGSDKVLREMNRKYSRAEYLEAVRRIRSALPECGLTSDLIVGFPGESESEYEESVSLLKDVRFDLVHTAAYSPRPGTPAASRSDQVSPAERARRLNSINRIQEQISKEINESLVGRTFDLLIDEPLPGGEGALQGRTVTDKVVLLSSSAEMIGKIASAKVTSAGSWCLRGEIIDGDER